MLETDLEKRCPDCNHMFFKVQNPLEWSENLRLNVKCPKCKAMCVVTHHKSNDYTVPTIKK